MWVSIRYITILTIFETILFNTVSSKYVDEEITTKTFHPVKITEKSTTVTPKVIKWESITDTEETNRSTETNEKIPDTTAVPAVESKTVSNVTLRTWQPADSKKPTKKPNVTQIRSNTTLSKKFIHPKCKYFKSGHVNFDLNRMADIWQTMYYLLQDKVQCFRMYIKKVPLEEGKFYNDTYGSFGGKINWANVFLEIESVTQMNRRHFLQGNKEDKGVMENIIIIEDKEHLKYVLHEESADQWMVFQKLLLMRDCDSGGIVVFSKVPSVPRQQDIVEALKEFGEEYGNGKLLCDDEEPVNRYYAIDDDDI